MPLQKLFPILFLVLVNACASGPKVTVYLSDPAAGGCEYYDPNTQAGGFVPYSSTDKFVCFNPTDAQTLINFCGISNKQAITAAKQMGFPSQFVSVIPKK